MTLSKAAHRTVVLATRNESKVRELRSQMANSVQIVSLEQVGYEGPSPEEPFNSYEANAIHKARVVAAATGLPALSDDAGFEVDCLKGIKYADVGYPGFDTKTFYERAQSVEASYNVLSDLVTNIGRTTDHVPARAICVLALASPNGSTLVVRGEDVGQMVRPRGDYGFVFDSIFQPSWSHMTYSEMTPESKNAYGFRAMAAKAMMLEMRELRGG